MPKVHRAGLLVRVGKRIRDHRVRRGWTQEEVALRIDLSPSYYAGIERGIYNPSLLTLALVAEALGVSIHALLGND